MEKSNNIKFNFFKFINTGIIGPLISFGFLTSFILFLVIFFGIQY